MNITMILEMAASAGDRPVVTADGRTLTAPELLGLARSAADRFRDYPAVLYLGTNHLAYPVALFGAAIAGVPFVPMNYRLGEHQLDGLQARHPGALVLKSGDLDGFLETTGAAPRGEEPVTPMDQDAVAVLLYTSGTTSEPKAAVLRHKHLLAYVLNTLEFASADEGAAALVAVPPYHIAGLANLLTNIYTGRRVVYLSAFDPVEWLETVRREAVTHALLVPTMLARIVDVVEGDDARTPTLANLAYGGSRMPQPVLERALKVFSTTGFVNAYGLTETASSVAVLGPGDHRKAMSSDDPAVRARLGSVGRPVPGVEFQIRSEEGEPLGPDEIGLVFVRGDQISGEYSGRSVLDSGGWFPTRDRGRLDAEGYLFIEGRADDTIIRGGENIAPAEIEDVLLTHPAVNEAVVVGVPDEEWGQRIVAFVVHTTGAAVPGEDELKRWVKDRLRSSKTPDSVVTREELPKTDTGKLLRRVLLTELENTHA
ncbi:hypothetical protein GCM10010439_67290 [Actinocorallia aurantiaca]|uniref:Acyl-CoA synthetase (AMP-forming)/AMP-acid ligase II n=2 Tax=Actinocorallia aurantiaca TaxID=46204 RepID=A0ABN3UQY8_9ACTN